MSLGSSRQELILLNQEPWLTKGTLQVGIVGAGIIGLAAAIALRVEVREELEFLVRLKLSIYGSEVASAKHANQCKACNCQFTKLGGPSLEPSIPAK